MSHIFHNNHVFTAENFLAVLGIFLGVHILLSYAGLVPSEVSVFNQKVITAVAEVGTLSYERAPTRILPRPETSPAADTVAVLGAPPERIVIEEIGVDAPISSPDVATIEVLDAALTKGVVHYPGSGGISGDRRMFLFGHSSRLPVVQNEAYRSFNGLNKLEAGDTISVMGGGLKQTYRVQSVRVVDKDEALVSFDGNGSGLTLSTCTTFGTRENRVVVRANLESSTAIKGNL